MSTSSRHALPRLAAASLGAILALPALSGGTALAAGPQDQERRPTQAQQRSDAAERDAEERAAAEERARAERQEAAEAKAKPAKAKPASSSKPAKAKPAKSAKAKPAKAKPAKSSKAKPAGSPGSAKPRSADPRGNNGTIKINTFSTTDGNANHPHPGCGFRLQMFNFDANQTGTITFVGQAPTAGAVTRQPLAGSQLLSDDAAGGGQDVDAFYDVTAASLGLTGTPHPKQGWHVKVLVDADNAPGGAKQKVFWLSCPAGAAPAPTAPSEGEGEGGGSLTPLPDEAPIPPSTSEETAAADAPQLLPFAAPEAAPVFTGGGSTTTLFESQAAGSFTQVLAVATTPRAPHGVAGAPTSAGEVPLGPLPFTGAAIHTLIAIALLTLGAGSALLYGGRRREI